MWQSSSKHWQNKQDICLLLILTTGGGLLWPVLSITLDHWQLHAGYRTYRIPMWNRLCKMHQEWKGRLHLVWKERFQGMPVTEGPLKKQIVTVPTIEAKCEWSRKKGMGFLININLTGMTHSSSHMPTASWIKRNQIIFGNCYGQLNLRS